MGYRNYAPSNGFLVDKLGNGDFTTITAAYAAATSGTRIFLNPGTYTENFTAIAGTELVGFSGDGITPNVTIAGKISFASAGTITITGVRLQTNSDNFLAVTGSAASIVNLNQCYLNISNNTGISFTTANTAAKINLQYCTGDIGTTGIGIYNSSSTGSLLINFGNITNSGLSTTASTNSAGAILFQSTYINSPISCTSTGRISADNLNTNCSAISTTAITANGSGQNIIYNAEVGGGTASAISVGNNLTLVNSIIDSSNTNAITGSGGISYLNIMLTNSLVINTTSQGPFTYANLGRYKASFQPSFFAYQSASITNATGNGTAYVLGTTALTKKFDQNANFNTNGTFTAPVAGIYYLSMCASAANLTSLMTEADLTIIASGVNYNGCALNAFTTQGLAFNGWTNNMAIMVSMAAGDTATSQIVISGGAGKTATILGSSSPNTYFMGYQIA